MLSRFALGVFVSACLVAIPPSRIVASDWEWQLADPIESHLFAIKTDTGIVTIATVQLINGCQEPFFIPRKTKFSYDLKIRTQTGVMCTQVIRDEVASFFEKGTTTTVRVRTKSGLQRVSVKAAPQSAPTP